ncbi:exopolysaccharide transport family protein [Granulicella cerasi]|uniref:Exopolysaccharide transport family protein n=1 Tax=Granulicella cerasi TaxID=741063 RepID=A0ABW1Z6V4_9BACT|nr:lipopolysaccharide biosynthesis protein [Granulicella cerasi]
MTGLTPPKLRQMVTEAVFRRKTVFWRVFLVVFGLALLASFAIPKRYVSEARLMVQPVRATGPLTTTPTDRLVAANQVSPEEINSEVSLLQSQGVARRALGQSLTAPQSRSEEQDAQTLERHLTVDAVHQTNLIHVEMVGKSPADATATLRRVLNAYFEERGGSGISSGAAGFFDRQAAAKNQQIADDQQKLTQFEVDHGIADLDEQKKLQVESISGLQAQMRGAEAQLAAQRSRTAANKRELSLTPARSRTVERTATNQYSQERLGTSLVDLENRRTELMKRYPPTDRQVVEANEKIATTRAAIAQAGENPAAETTTDVNPVYQQLSSAVALSQGEASAESAQVAEIRAQMKSAQGRLEELEQATAEYNELKRQLAQAQADFTLYAQRRDEARISEALDKARMFNVSLAEAPMASSLPVRPKPVVYMAAGTVAALLLGILAALYADTVGEQVYNPSQLDQRTGMRTIATLAEEDGGVSEANRLEYQRILLAIRQGLESRLDVQGGGRSGHTAAEQDGSLAGYCVAFVSALRGEGSSHLATQLASEASRERFHKVAVLDARLLLRKFETEEDLTFAVRHDEERGFWVLDIAEPGLSVGAGETTAATSLHKTFSSRLRPMLIEARREFDFIFIDCPSLQDSTLAPELARTIDGYVAVVGAGYARKQNIEGMNAALTGITAPLLGWVLTRRTYPVPRWIYGLIG